jgi:hypothetical protein
MSMTRVGNTRHQEICAAVAAAATFVKESPSTTSRRGTNMVTIRIKHADKPIQVRDDIAIARLDSGVAVLVTKDGERDFPYDPNPVREVPRVDE